MRKSLLWRIIKSIVKGVYVTIKFAVLQVHHSLKNQAVIINRAFLKRKKRPLKKNPSNVPLKLVQTLKGDFDDFKKNFVIKESFVALVLGSRGSGKTAFGLRLMENLHSENAKKCFALGFDPSSLPSWIGVIKNLDELANDSLVLIDESGIQFSSRSSMSSANKLLSELLFICRHKNVSLIFVSQNSANIEINAIRQADVLFLKQFSLLQLDFERKKIRDIYKIAGDGFKTHKAKGLTFIYAAEFQGFVMSSLPSFWSQSVSKAFAGHKMKNDEN